jgi:hypothetical protein
LHLLVASVFSPGSHTAPDMSLLFVDIQNLPHLLIQVFVAAWQALG